MSHSKWVVKVKRYDGSTSVVTKPSTEEAAQKVADHMNSTYQSSNYYIEEWRHPWLSAR